jgi:hypothetical protein
MRPQAVSRRVTLCRAAALALVSVAAATAADAERPPEGPMARYEIRVVRIDPQAGSVVFRLDSATGAVCAYAYEPRSDGEARGCVGGVANGGPGRFSIEAAQGARGSNRSSAYRLDRQTGAICRFRLPALTGAGLEAAGCIKPPTEGTPL